MRPLPRIGPSVLLLLAPVILISPVLFTGKALFWGTPALQFVPWREFAWSALREGNLPLWNPWLGMGAPLFANYQTALAYPPNWLLFMLSSLGGVEWHAWGQTLVVALHWMLAGFGMQRLSKELGLGELSQTVAGLAYALCGYLVARAGFLSINAATAWLPWVLLYSGRIASSRFRGASRKSTFIGIFSLVVALMLLSGHAQIAWYISLLAIIWGVYWASADEYSPSGISSAWTRITRRWAPAGAAVFWLGAGFFGGAALAAVQLLPTAEYLLQSQRAAAVDYEYAMTYSFWPWRLLTLLAPDFFGTPVRGDYWGYGSYWEDALYVGLLPLLLVLSVIVLRLASRRGKSIPRDDIPGLEETVRPRSGAVPFLMILILISLLLAFGKNTPLFPWLYRHVPTLDMFQAPARFALWAEFALALLAGFGVDAWRRPKNRALYWTRLGTAGAGAMTIGAALAWYFMGDVSPSFIRATAVVGLLGVGSGALSLLAPPEGSQDASGWWHWLVAGFVAVDLVAAGWGLNPGVERAFYSQAGEGSAALHSFANGRRVYTPSDVEQELKFERFLRFDTFNPGMSWLNLRQAELPNLTMLDSIPSVNNFDPLVAGRYARWMELLDRADSTHLESLLDLSGVGVVQELDSSRESGVSYRFQEEEVGSRVRLVPCGISAADEDEAFEQVQALSFDPGAEVVLEGWSAAQNPSCIPGLAPGTVGLVSEVPGSLVLESQADNPGWLLLSDVWYPGWQAYVDGQRQPIYRADYLFRAVELEAGEHKIIFEYRPASFYCGAVISLAALGVFILAVALQIPRKPNSAPRS